MAAELTKRFTESPVSPARLFNWIKRDGGPPPEYCAAMEEIVDGQVTRQQFRPDDWQVIWPELIAALRDPSTRTRATGNSTNKPGGA